MYFLRYIILTMIGKYMKHISFSENNPLNFLSKL